VVIQSSDLFPEQQVQENYRDQKSGKTVIQDRTIYEDAFIFAPNLHGMNLMSTRDLRITNRFLS